MFCACQLDKSSARKVVSFSVFINLCNNTRSISKRLQVIY